MLSFHVKFVQKEGQTDNGKTICPHLSIQGHKNNNWTGMCKYKHKFHNHLKQHNIQNAM